MTLPRGAAGRVDLDVFARHLRFVHAAGVEGLVLNGATGECCLTSSEELGQIIHRAREVAGMATPLIAAVGGASLFQTLVLVDAAQTAGANALLLPMPYFFPYEQQDLIAFSKAVVAHAELPLLLYNLPLFTTPLEPVTTLQLVQETDIVGIKDSSGNLDTLRLLSQSCPNSNRIIGSDGALHGAMLEGLCDGVVSGVASVLPELMIAFYRAAATDPRSSESLKLNGTVEAVLSWLGRFPIPWGLKIIAAERGFFTADFALPLSPQRQADAVEFKRWFHANRKLLLATASLETK